MKNDSQSFCSVAPFREENIRGTRGLERIFSVFLLYYWFLLYIFDSEKSIESFSFRYFLYVAPSVLLVVVMFFFAIQKRTIKPPVLILLFLIMFTLFGSLILSDYRGAVSVLLLLTMMLLILHLRIPISLNFLNVLLLLSAFFAVPAYHLGLSDYGYLPGQSLTSRDQGLDWRVSLFPSLPESGLFSGLLLVLNLFVKNARFRFSVIFISSYFLLLSGSRTSLLAVALVFLFVGFLRLFHLRVLGAVIFYVCLILFFFCLVGLPSLTIWISGLGVEWINSYIFRSVSPPIDGDYFQTTVYRVWLWGQHLNIFWDNFWFGAGSFNLSDHVEKELIPGHAGTGSESFMTSFLARVGVFGILLPISIFVMAFGFINRKQFLLAGLTIYMLIVMLAYGSVFVPYNLIFFILLAILSDSNKQASL